MFCAIHEFSVTVLFGWKAVEMKSLLKRSEKGEMRREKQKAGEKKKVLTFPLLTYFFSLLTSSFSLLFA